MNGQLGEGEEAVQEAPAASEAAEEIDIDLNDPEVEAAASKIQAGFKGMKARKDIAAMKEEAKEEVAAEAEGEAKTEAEGEAKAEAPSGEAEVNDTEQVDIDLNDPDVQAAATKIQASFKGYKTRKDLKAGEGEGEPQSQE